VPGWTDGSAISDSKKRKGDGGSIYLAYRQAGSWPQNVSGFELSTLRENIAPFEPARNVTRDFPPTLLIHGTEDHDVPHEESANMATEFSRNGVPFILKSIEKGGHGFGGGNQEQIDDAYRTMDAFIARYLEPQRQPPRPRLRKMLGRRQLAYRRSSSACDA